MNLKFEDIDENILLVRFDLVDGMKSVGIHADLHNQEELDNFIDNLKEAGKLAFDI